MIYMLVTYKNIYMYVDVDDTLLCSGGSYPSGLDKSYLKKTLYPGVLAFYRELDLGAIGPDDTWNNSKQGNLVFLSARPHVYKGASEDHTLHKLELLRQQKNRGLHTCPSLLAGDLETGGEFMLRDTMEPLAMKKFENLRQYAQIYPEYTMVLIGDNGQGDVRTAEMAFDMPSLNEVLERVYIHEVQPLSLTHTKKNLTRMKSCPKICYFITYIDAAIDALNHKLIRLTGFRRVVEEAISDFLSIPDSSWQGILYCIIYYIFT